MAHIKRRHKVKMTGDYLYVKTFVKDLLWGLYKYIDVYTEKYELQGATDRQRYDNFCRRIAPYNATPEEIQFSYQRKNETTGKYEDDPDAEVANFNSTGAGTVHLHPLLWKVAKTTIAYFNGDDGMTAEEIMKTTVPNDNFGYHYNKKNKTFPKGKSFAEAYVDWVIDKAVVTEQTTDSGATVDVQIKHEWHSGVSFSETETWNTMHGAYDSVKHEFSHMWEFISGGDHEGNFFIPLIKERVVFDVAVAVLRTVPIPERDLEWSVMLRHRDYVDGADADADVAYPPTDIMKTMHAKMQRHNTTVSKQHQYRVDMAAAYAQRVEDVAEQQVHVDKMRHIFMPLTIITDLVGGWFRDDEAGGKRNVEEEYEFLRPPEPEYWDSGGDNFVLMKNSLIRDIDEVFLDRASNTVATLPGRALTTFTDTAGIYTWGAFDVRLFGYDDRNIAPRCLINEDGVVDVADAPCHTLDTIRKSHVGPWNALLRGYFAFQGSRFARLEEASAEFVESGDQDQLDQKVIGRRSSLYTSMHVRALRSAPPCAWWCAPSGSARPTASWPTTATCEPWRRTRSTPSWSSSTRAARSRSSP